MGSHLIAKKVGGLKCSTQVNLKASSMLPVFFTLVFCFSIQPSLHTHKKKKKKHWVLILAQKISFVQRKILRIKLKILKKNHNSNTQWFVREWTMILCIVKTPQTLVFVSSIVIHHSTLDLLEIDFHCFFM